MQNHHHGSQSHHLVNSWADLAGTFSHLDANTAPSSSTELISAIIPAPAPNSSYLFTNYDQNRRLIHPFGDNIAHGDPASITEPATFPTLPPIISTSRGNAAKSAEICNSNQRNHNPSALTPVSNSATKGQDLQDELAFARACLLAFTAASSDVGTNSMSRTGSLSDFRLGANKGVSFKKSGKLQISGTHVVSESIRRKQLTRLFYTLRSLLPNIVPQHDRCSVIDKACEYIKSLERQLQVLKRKAQILASIANESSGGDPKPKLDADANANANSNGKIIKIPPPPGPCSMAGADDEKAPHVQIALAGNTSININIGCYEKKKGLFPILLNIMEKRHLQVLSANRSQQGQTVLYAIHVEAQQSSFPSQLELQKLKAELYSQVATMLL